MSGQAFPSVPGGGGGAGTPASTVTSTSSFGQSSAVGTSTDYARADHVHGSPAAPPSSEGWFGHGIDGDLTVTGTTTLTRDTFYNNLTISATGVVKPAGWRLHVLGTLTIESGGTINDDGTSNTTSNPLTGLGSRGALNAASGGGSAGGNASVGSAGGANSVCSPNTSFVLPNGGAGGNAGANAGGAGGVATTYNAQTSLNVPWLCLTAGFAFGRGSSANVYNGGAGGGGGASATGGTFGGGGGVGGGGVWVAAKTINNAGRISANGGNGANASGGAGNAGGGGGGGGGYAIVIYQSTTGSGVGTVQANAGTGGTGLGTGANGAAGVAGIARTLKMG